MAYSESHGLLRDSRAQNRYDDPMAYRDAGLDIPLGHFSLMSEANEQVAQGTYNYGSPATLDHEAQQRLELAQLSGIENPENTEKIRKELDKIK